MHRAANNGNLNVCRIILENVEEKNPSDEPAKREMKKVVRERGKTEAVRDDRLEAKKKAQEEARAASKKLEAEKAARLKEAEERKAELEKMTAKKKQSRSKNF